MTLYMEHLIQTLSDADYRNELPSELLDWLVSELEAEMAACYLSQD